MGQLQSWLRKREVLSLVSENPYERVPGAGAAETGRARESRQLLYLWASSRCRERPRLKKMVASDGDEHLTSRCGLHKHVHTRPRTHTFRHTKPHIVMSIVIFRSVSSHYPSFL